MLRWSSIAPLATPVVPPVYCRNAMSSCAERHAARSVALAAFGERVAQSASRRRCASGGTIFFTWRSTKSTSMPLMPEHLADAW